VRNMVIDPCEATKHNLLYNDSKTEYKKTCIATCHCMNDALSPFGAHVVFMS